jgi:signal transduction histidine kinase/CheY-like chemotaxis protein
VPWLDRIVAEEPRIRPGSAVAYAIAALLVALSLSLRLAAGDWVVGYRYITFWPAIVLAGLIGGLGPGLLAAMLGGICAWTLLRPYWTYGHGETGDIAAFLVYLLFSAANCAIIQGLLTAVARLRAERTKQRQLAQSLEVQILQRTQALAAANAQLRREIAERERAQQQMLHAQKMEAIGQLTGGVAHDFNNLLTVIFGSLDALRLRLVGRDAAAERMIEAALRSAERGAGLTQRLLAFARRQTLAPASVDINRLVLGMSELMRHSLGASVALETVLAAGLWRAQCDPHQLEIAMLNLVINARDAMPEGGRLTVETANATFDEAYAARHDQVSPGDYVMVAISDTGAGMSEEVAARAFEPFFTTKEVGQGTGLGLSMVYGFVKQSGGHVKIYTEPQHGTTVKVYLPRSDAGQDRQPASRGAGDAANGPADGTILVVEDDEDVRSYTAQVLRQGGYAVLEANNGAAALAVMGSGARIDLLFTDVMMPRMNGRELAEAARRLSRDLKIIFTSGYSPNALFHGGTLEPGTALLPKPFTAEALLRRVHRALGARA